MKLFSVLVLSLVSSTVLAGPGVSSGDGSTAKVAYLCNQPTADSSLAAIFENVDAAKPTVTLSVPTGESSDQSLSGECTQVMNADEFFVTCTVQGQKDTYDITLYSEGSPALKSTVKKVGDDQTFVLTCSEFSE